MASENHRHNFKHRTQHYMTYPHPWRYGQRFTGVKAAFRFFAEHAGGIVGRNAEIALMMARAGLAKFIGAE